MSDPERGTGRTTRQMLDAPKDAIFVWCNGHLGYPLSLARHLGRSDLRIASPQAYEAGRMAGLRNCVVIDHWIRDTIRHPR